MATRPVSLIPTDQQRAIVECRQPRILVEANAGAAKTTTAAMRIRDEIARGARPNRILVLAYTRPGCQAMANALPRVGVPAAVAKAVRIRTFDDFCTRRLGDVEGRTSTPLTPERVKPHVLEAIRRAREMLPERYAADFGIAGLGEMAVEGLLRAFQLLKGTMALHEAGNDFALTPGTAHELGSDYTTIAVLRAHERLRCDSHDKDAMRPLFRYEDDATYDMARLLTADDPSFSFESHPLALGLDYLVVDELHDLNRAMFTVLQGLLRANPKAGALGVGDRDQVIHSEAGADAALMRESLDVDGDRAARLPLETSFRFDATIAALLSGHSHKPYASRSAWESRIEVLELGSPRALCIEVHRAVRERRGLREGAPLAELAVLLRRPSRSVDLENYLLDKGIDYAVDGFESYLRRPEILFFRGILSHALDAFGLIEIDDVRQAVVQATLFFTGGSVLTTTEGIDEQAWAREQDDIAQQATAATFQQHVMPRMLDRIEPAARGAIEEAMAIARSNRVEDIGRIAKTLGVEAFASRVLVHAAAVRDVADSMRGVMAAAAEFDSIEAFLRGTNQREVNQRAMRGRRQAEALRLSTIEAAKGLEFDHVIVPGVDAGDFDGDSVEERNLFYVAASRARRLLTLAHAPGRRSSYLDAPKR